MKKLKVIKIPLFSKADAIIAWCEVERIRFDRTEVELKVNLANYRSYLVELSFRGEDSEMMLIMTDGAQLEAMLSDLANAIHHTEMFDITVKEIKIEFEEKG